MVIDLLSTNDSSLIGAIGEIIAWKYLWSRKIRAHRFASEYPWLRDYPMNRLNFEFPWLNKQQVEYLRNLWQRGPRRWDFIGVKYKRDSSGAVHSEPEEVYSIEVKTRRIGRERHDLSGLFKGKISEDIPEVKSRGFKPLLIIVDLLDNWKFKITYKEL